MRNKYKRKQYLEKEESKIKEKPIDKSIQITTIKSYTKNNTLLNSKSTDKFNRTININISKKENKSNPLINKNTSSISFKKDISNYSTFTKNFYDKNIYQRNNIEKTEENNNQKSSYLKVIKNYSLKDGNKDKILNINNSYNNENIKENNQISKNNSQKFNTIFLNSRINKKEKNYTSNRSIYITHNYQINKSDIKENQFNTNIINNNKNYRKLSIVESVDKNANVLNNISRNRSFIPNNDYFCNRINKNYNQNNDNNYSLNEKSNSLSIISEKISLLNSYEDNSNSLQKEEKEKNLNKNYFNIIETEIKEENDNIKNDKNILRKNSKTSIIYKNKRYENNNLFWNDNIISPTKENGVKHYKFKYKKNETEINVENNNQNKINLINNNNVDEIGNKKIIASNIIIDRIKKENYSYKNKGQFSNNYCSFLKELKDNINNTKINNTKSNQINNENTDFNKTNPNKIFNMEGETLRVTKKLKNNNNSNNNNNSYIKTKKEIDTISTISNMENKQNKEININNNINNIHNNKNKQNIFLKKNQTLPLKSFKFLVHQANYNDLIKDSFNKYYEANKKNTNNNLNESLTLSSETNFSAKMKYNSNNNILSDLLDFSKKDNIKSPMSSISNFCFHNDNDNFSEEEESNKNRNKLSIKHKLIKTSKSDIFHNLMNNSFDMEKNNYKFNNFFINKNKRKNYSGIINNNIFSTTLNIYKFNDNNNDDISQIKSIFRNNQNFIKVNNIKNNYINQNYNYKGNNIPSLIYSDSDTDDIDLKLFYNLEKKILMLINKIEDYKICKNECYDYIKYYFDKQIDEHIIKLFNNNHNRINIINYIKLELLCYFLCYDITFSNFFNQAVLLIKSIINILNNNFLLIILLFLSNFNKKLFEQKKEMSKGEKLIVNELNEIIKDNLTIRLDGENINELYIIQSINNNTKNINNYYKMILDNLYKDYYTIKNDYNYNINNKYKFPNCLNNTNDIYNNLDKKIIIILFFYDSYRLLNNYNINDLKKFFDLFLDKIKLYNFETETNNINILHMTTSTPSFPLSSNISKKSLLNRKKEINLNKNKIYILPDLDKSKYKYSLILPLNEVLIYFNPNNNSYMPRPYLFEFLNKMKEIFELILISSDFSNYEEQIIEDIQKGNKLFDYILNRNHGIDNANSVILDLISLNRNLKHFLIIDTSLNRFKIHKNNILIIKPFYGDVKNDKNILHLLGQLLKKIILETDTTDDIRYSINKYKKSFIYSKITK